MAFLGEKPFQSLPLPSDESLWEAYFKPLSGAFALSAAGNESLRCQFLCACASKNHADGSGGETLADTYAS